MKQSQRSEGKTPSIGDVYIMDFEGFGSEQKGRRPGLVFQNNTGNTHSPNVIALPLTSSLKKTSQPTHVVVRAKDTGLLRDSMVLCENPVRMSKEKLGTYITSLSGEYMRQIAIANLLATSAVSYLNEADLIEVWKQSMQLNCTVA